MIAVTLNGRSIQARSGQSILDVARTHGIAIPTLCHLPHRRPRAVCRMCMVEIVGEEALVPACSTVIRPGLEVRTHSARIQRIRRTVMELTLAEHNGLRGHDPVLRDLSERLGVSQARFRLPERDLSRYREIESEYIRLDLSRCVHCDRCIRACGQRRVITRAGFGIQVSMAFDYDVSIEESSCIQCGDCIQACPSGAIARA